MKSPEVGGGLCVSVCVGGLSFEAPWVGRFTGAIITGRRSDQWGRSCLVNCHFDRVQCQKSLACVTFDTADTTHIKILTDASSVTVVCAIKML